MTPTELAFDRIEIRRMPGFPRGGIDLVDLSPDVNVVFGPNASGKTTISRAIQKLLHPSDPPHRRRSLFASVEIQGQTWTIDYDVGRIRYQRNGADEERVNLASADVADRYVLALHELVRTEDDSNLASIIVRESAGGFDVSEAARVLAFRDRPTGKGKRTKELEAAIQVRREALRRQDSLLKQETFLNDLRNRQESARSAAIRLELLERALDDLQKSQQVFEAEENVNLFAPGISLLTGNELDRLTAIRKSLATTKDRRRQEQHRLDRARQTLKQSDLPDEGLPPELLGTLRQKCQKLQAMDTQILDARRDRDEAAAEMDQARRILGPSQSYPTSKQTTEQTLKETPEQILKQTSEQILKETPERLDLGLVDSIAQFARRAQQVRAETLAADSLRVWLGSNEEEANDPDLLHQAAWLLGRWTVAEERARVEPALPRWLAISVAACVALVSIGMVFWFHLSWLVILAAAIGGLIWALLPTRIDERPNELRREIEGLGLGVPETWTPADVATFANELRRQADDAGLRRERATKWNDLETRRKDLLQRQRVLATEKYQWHDRLGLDVDAVETDETWLTLFAANANRLQQADSRHAAAEARFSNTKNEYESLLTEIATELERFGFDPVDRPETASACIEQLATRQQAFVKATATLDGSNLTELEDDISKALAAERELFERFGLMIEQESTLCEWVRLHPAYLDAVDALSLARHDMQTGRAVLDKHPELRVTPKDMLLEERDQCRDKADGLESIHREIGGIEASIDSAKQAADLEAALANERAKAETLREARRRDYRAMVGGVLADFLARYERDRHRPDVFRRAQKLFAQITHGRFRLDIDPGEPPAFRALDTDRNEGLALEELSSGTRLQLLLAVRLAFVERMEQGLKLPLILDETLGNSDEQRASQIIDAAIEVCRQGRQVFYFTAQQDEARKWEIMLNRRADVAHKLIDLAKLRGFSESERMPEFDFKLPEPSKVPSPEGHDWVAYGRLLNIPPLDPNRELGGTHLWYLIDDPIPLYRLLKQDINRWGQFRTLASLGHDERLSVGSETFKRAEAVARLLEAATKCWRIGRGEKVDRQVLSESKAVSSTFLDQVSQIAEKRSGDARRLIDALESGQVRGFRTDKRKLLRQFLTTQGYLDPREILTPEEIREQVRVAIFADLESGLIHPHQFERLLSIVSSFRR